MKSGRPLARLVLTFGLLVLGTVALARLPLDYLPRQSFPELTVILSLGDATDPGLVTREWVEEIEEAVRTLGRVEEVGGEVRSDGARLTVRFAPGTDPQRKAARLESELAHLRRRLGQAGGLWITPASEAEGELFAIVWLAGTSSDRRAEAAAEELRAVPGVQAVEVYGTHREEVRVETRGAALDPWEEAEAVRAEVERSLRAPALGRVRHGDREWPLVVPPQELETVAVPRGGGAMSPILLGSLASVRSRWQDPPARVRYRGEPARALFVWRAHGASPLKVDSDLRRRLETVPGGTLGWSEAEPLRELVVRLALALLLASLAAAITGGWLAGRWGALALGLALPAALAAAANAFWLAGTGLNVTTLVALAIGTSAVLPATLLRAVGKASVRGMAFTAIASAVAVPVTVALASEELGPLLSEPAGAFLLAVGAAVVAAAVVPRKGPKRLKGPKGHKRQGYLPGPLRPLSPLGPFRNSLRDPGTAVLFAATLAYLAAALFGASLLPKPADLAPDTGSLVLRLQLPEGTTLEETARRVREIESHVTQAEEIESFWGLSREGEGFVRADVRRRDRRPDRLARLVTRLRYQTAAIGSLTIETAGTGGNRTARRLEERAETDEEANAYRAVLRSADLETFLEGYDRILYRLAGMKIRSHWVVRHDVQTFRLALRPLPGVPPERAAALAGHLRRASTPPGELRLPSRTAGAERTLLVAPVGTPTDPDDVPQMAALLQRPLLIGGEPFLPASSLALREEVVHVRVARQSGRFVMPVDLRIGLFGEDARRAKRLEVDRSLGQLDLPAGCDLERPSLAPGLWQSERVRLIALGAAVPLLLFAVAACRLGSLLRGLVALAPLGLGLLAATPLIHSALGQADEITVFALAAALALALPSIIEGSSLSPGTGERAGERGDGINPSRIFRSLRQETPWVLGAVPALAIGLFAPTLGLDPLLLRWVTPLRAAAVAGGTSLLTSALLSPALLLLARGAAERLRHPEEVRRRQHPPQWSSPGAPLLEAHTVTKVYGGKVTALSGVRFELTPGIVGLLGPNGAGKTTLLRILTGLLDPSRGEVRFRGVAVGPENLSEYRRQIGFLPQEFNAYPELTAEQFLDHWAVERGMGERERRQEIERLLAAVGLTEHTGRKVRDFSGGMRQRVGIARALLGSPPILIVDEPTTGLDVESRTRFRQILLEQAAERIVLFSTHIASDVEAAASRILLLHRGRLRFDGTPEELTARARGRVFRALIGDEDLAAFSRRCRITARVRTLEGIRVRAVARPGDALPGEEIEPNLEEAYLAEIDLAEALTPVPSPAPPKHTRPGRGAPPPSQEGQLT